MVKIDDEGVKVGKVYWPFAVYEDCGGCRYRAFLEEAEGTPVGRDICKMTPEIEDEFLFSDMPEAKIPPCLRE